MKPETAEWVRIADGDIGVAKLVLDQGFVRASLFHSHEAVEKILKPIWIEQRSEEPERTHNLLYLAREVGIKLDDEQKEFLRKLFWQLIPSRYPEGTEPGAETARWYYDGAKEIYSWLRQRLT
ncbi:MAG: HEPN domain-containing protein [Dehalococcoidia bacterium]